jgi:hypothetical protein
VYIRRITHENIRQRHHENYALRATSYGRTYKRTRFFFGLQVTCFLRDPSRQFKTPTSLFYKEVYKRSGTRKDNLLRLRSSATNTFNCLINNILLCPKLEASKDYLN